MKNKVAYSAALCRGLIEAGAGDRAMDRGSRCIPRLYAAASLKRNKAAMPVEVCGAVFRGSMPRPH